MEEKELKRILSNFDYFIDDDFGGHWVGIIGDQRANTNIGALKIIDTFKELQQENAQYKEQVAFHEKYNKEASDQIIKDEEVIKQLKEQRSKAIEYIKNNSENGPGLTGLFLGDLFEIEKLLEILESNKED